MNRTMSRQSGLTAIEVTLSLLIMAIVTIGLAQIFNRSQDSLAVASAASRLGEVRLAASRYIRDNFSAVESAASAGAMAIPVAALVSADYLPPAYQNANEFGQAHQVYVRRRAAGVLESLVVTTGGRPLSLMQGGRAAVLLKAAGGYVPIGAAQAIGSKGAWTAALSSFVPGGQPLPSGGLAAYALHRAVEGPTGALMRFDTGNPADNRVETNLNLNNNSILGAANLSTSSLTIGGQVLTLTDAQTLAALSGASCGVGQALTKVGAALSCIGISGVPAGTIAGFGGSCPAGWAALGGAAGRTLVGAGGGYSAGQVGGADFVTLTLAQIPAHWHGMADNVVRDVDLPLQPNSTLAWSNGNSPGEEEVELPASGTSNAPLGRSGLAGGGQAFDNRQAYYVVNYCEKS